jgi:hypothetical protein
MASERERAIVAVRTRAVGDVGVCGAADGGEAEREGGVDLDADAGVVLVLDQHAQALGALPQHLAQAAAAVRRRRARLPLHVLQARRQPHQLVRALAPVRAHVAAGHRRRRQHHRQRRRPHHLRYLSHSPPIPLFASCFFVGCIKRVS